MYLSVRMENESHRDAHRTHPGAHTQIHMPGVGGGLWALKVIKFGKFLLIKNNLKKDKSTNTR